MKNKSKSKSGEATSREVDPESVYGAIQFEGLTNPNQRAFLAAFSVCGRPGKAAALSGVHRQTHYFWLRTDKVYRDAYASCRDNVAYKVEGSLVERLIHGWREPVFQGGQLVGYKRKFDNATAWKLLQKLRPEVYGDADGNNDDEFVIEILELPDNGRG